MSSMILRIHQMVGIIPSFLRYALRRCAAAHRQATRAGDDHCAASNKFVMVQKRANALCVCFDKSVEAF